MNDTTEATPEVYPWDAAPLRPVDTLRASLFVMADTTIEPFDRPYESEYDNGGRVIGLDISELTLHIGVSGGDEEVVTVCDRLTEALQEVRIAALARIVKREPAVAS